ncbi:hypothetical protein [Halalkalirubrum salinum]|uniref:hypothetical protein n=1 Tax=Halalkalirubrum salinum TaxID=2563889 RepID=UPI0010FB725A|nr:hypothetical protein [Halalkalirubrum salinum]
MRLIELVLNAFRTKTAIAAAPYETIIREADRLAEETEDAPSEAFLDRLAQAIDTADAAGKDSLAEHGQGLFDELRSRSR